MLQVGDRFTTRSHLLTAEDIIRFASEFDPQPFHVDADRAAGTLFAGLAGSGWHIAGITMRLLVETVPAASGIIGTEAHLEWPTPSRPGDELTVRVTVEAVTPSRSRPDRARVTLACETIDQRDEVRQRLRATVLVDDSVEGAGRAS
jgi:acyl dehydratase